MIKHFSCIFLYWCIISCDWLSNLSLCLDNLKISLCIVINLWNYISSLKSFWILIAPWRSTLTCMICEKLYNIESTAVGKPLTFTNFILYLFKGLQLKFKNLVTTLMAQSELVTFSKLLSLFSIHEILHNDYFHMLFISSMFVDDVITSSTNIARQSTFTNKGNNFNFGFFSSQNDLFQ